MGMFVSICSSAWNSLKLGGPSLENKTATTVFKCTKCGADNTVETKVTKEGLKYDEEPGSGFQSLCPWNTK